MCTPSLASILAATFRAAGVDRLKRLTLIINRRQRTIHHALYPVGDPAGAIDDSLAVLTAAE